MKKVELIWPRKKAREQQRDLETYRVEKVKLDYLADRKKRK